MASLLLLSGGLDSSAICAITRPALALTIDYGQRPAPAEISASSSIAIHLEVAHEVVEVDLSPVGSGLLVGSGSGAGAPTPEWFPFRNQLLVSIAAAFAVTRGFDEIILGTVGGDGARHVDGTAAFAEAIDAVVRMQEGNVAVRAPFVDDDPADLLGRSGLPDGVLRWTFSCHTGVLACGQCPGCERRRALLSSM